MPGSLRGGSSRNKKKIELLKIYLSKSDEPPLSEPVVAGAHIVDFGQSKGLTFEKVLREKICKLLWNGSEAERSQCFHQ